MPPRDVIKMSPGNWHGSWALDTPPTPTVPDLPTATPTPIDAALNGFIAAANAGDIPRDLEHGRDHENRNLKYADATSKFPAHEGLATEQMTGVAAQSEGQMAQMIPQLVSGLAGAITGALGGALAPLAQLPQQLAQAGQQAMQAGMGAMPKSGDADPLDDKKLLATDLDARPVDDLGTSPDLGTTSPGAGPGIGTVPTAVLGPPVIPSPATFPAATNVPLAQVAPATTAAVPYSTGMGGMPLVPPGAMTGQGTGANDDKTDTKRVAVPPVKNGAPVQGRFTTPPEAPVAKRVEGKPVATRRIVSPAEVRNEDAKEEAPKG